jgi:hypothetical protein
MDTFDADMAMSLFYFGVANSHLLRPIPGLNRRRDSIHTSRTALVRQVLELTQSTHVLWWDSDNAAPINGLDRLLARDKDIVGTFYRKRLPPYEMVGTFYPESRLEENGLRKAAVMPHGFCLVKRSVYETMAAPWYRHSYADDLKCARNPDGAIGEDAYFSVQAMAAGFDIWCDTELTKEIGHVGTKLVRWEDGPDGNDILSSEVPWLLGPQ